mgnify:CR=1 FL=1
MFSVASSLNHSDAQKVIEAAVRVGRKYNTKPLAISVLDAGGHLVAYLREDGCGVLREQIARGKAYGALGMGLSSQTIAEKLGQRTAFLGAVAAASGGRFVPVPGGVLIIKQGVAVGAVGISGDNSPVDSAVAVQALRECGFACSPSEPAQDWIKSKL